MSAHLARPRLTAAAALGLAPAAAALCALLALAVLFLVTLDQGAALAAVGSALDSATTHEVFHDARHLLGVPCH